MTLRRRALWLLGCAVLAGCLAWDLVPKPNLYKGVGFSTLVTDRRGQLLRLLPADDGRYRLFTPLANIAPAAQEAVLLYEDRHFHRHPGVDPIALARAVWTTYIRRSRMVGGSTITMQLARMHFGLDTRSPFGKLVQAARALQLERHYTKADILEAYLNLAPYGGSVEGSGTASRIYFDKPARPLSRGEALALAVIPQNPTARFPATTAGRARLLAARTRLPTAWRASNSALKTAEETVARTQIEPVFRAPSALPAHARHFVRDHVARTGAAEMRTTLDLDLQTVLETTPRTIRGASRRGPRTRRRCVNHGQTPIATNRAVPAIGAVVLGPIATEQIPGAECVPETEAAWSPARLRRSQPILLSDSHGSPPVAYRCAEPPIIAQ